MTPDHEGFLYPRIDTLQCKNCGLCEKICPALHREKQKIQPDNLIAVINNDAATRKISSSGGVFTLLAETVIRQHGAVFGAAFDADFHVQHDAAESIEGLAAFRGSKYVQSSIGESYKACKKRLDEGQKALFSGTPCQIAGLKAYLQSEYTNLYCLDLICGGASSPKVWEKYLAYQKSIYHSKPVRISFRYKNPNWNPMYMLLEFENGVRYVSKNDLYFHKSYGYGISLRPSCFQCNFRPVNQGSDITLGDFWKIKKYFPGMYDRYGTSLVILNSEKGKELFEHIKAQCKYVYINSELSKEYARTTFKCFKGRHRNRDLFFKHLDTMPFDTLVKKYTDYLLIFRMLLQKIVRRCFDKLRKPMNVNTMVEK
jgi:coenzyme F420-reducing hydrogenase beta subunit